MNNTNAAPSWRCLLVGAGATAALAGLVALLRPDLAAATDALTSGHLAAVPFTDLLEWWCAGCAFAASAWLWAGTVALAASVARTGAPAARPMPVALPGGVRRAVLLACGAALSAGLAAPAHAADPHQHAQPAPAAAGSTASRLDGLPLPDRATGRGPRPGGAARPPVAALPAPAHRLASVVVHPGDTLWDLAQQALPGASRNEAVARRWQRVYALNRGVVGADPDLIRPGQRLRLPHV